MAAIAGTGLSRGGEAGARYDYLYSPEELAQLAIRARRLIDQAPEIYLIFNNHPRGQGVANAVEMQALLTGECPVLPESLKEAFPRLAYL